MLEFILLMMVAFACIMLRLTATSHLKPVVSASERLFYTIIGLGSRILTIPI